MKHVWVGAVLLAALLFGGLLLNTGLQRMNGALPGELKKAAEASLAGNWTRADGIMETVRSRWEKNREITASLTDHALLEEVDCLFSELMVYREQHLGSEYAAVCMCLARRIEAVLESQSLRWWHLL